MRHDAKCAVYKYTFMIHRDIIQAKITSKPRFENVGYRFYHELIPKAAMMKRIPM